MNIKIVEVGTGIKIKIMINDMIFYSSNEFDTEEEAKKFLSEHELKESE